MTEPQTFDTPPRGFESRAPLGAEQIDHIRWRTTHRLAFTDSTGITTVVEPGYLTDWATIPRAFAGVIPKSGQHNPATVIHDRLCQEAAAGRFHRRDADRIFYEALRDLEVLPTRAAIMWAGTRWGALAAHPDQWRDFVRDLPAVLPLTLLALPVVAPAAITTQLTLWPIIAAWEAVEHRVVGERKPSEDTQEGRRTP